MAAVGTVQCTFVKGEATIPTTKVRAWQTAGYESYGGWRTGGGDSTFNYSAQFFGVTADVQQWIDDILALKGTVVSITDDLGFVFDRCMITRMSRPLVRPRWFGSAPLQYKAMITITGVVLGS